MDGLRAAMASVEMYRPHYTAEMMLQLMTGVLDYAEGFAKTARAVLRQFRKGDAGVYPLLRYWENAYWGRDGGVQPF